jgi:hypothetical protein
VAGQDAWRYVGTIDGRAVLSSWYLLGKVYNIEKLTERELAVMLYQAFGWQGFKDGIYFIGTALIDPTFTFAEERSVMFSGLTYYLQSVRDWVRTYHVQPGYWDQNLRVPGLFMPRDGGRHYRCAWDMLLAQGSPVHRVYVESWNEYDEGSGIYAASPAVPWRNPNVPDRNTDTWSDADDPLEYIKTTAEGAAMLSGRARRDAVVLGHRIPTCIGCGEATTAEVLVRNAGSAVWDGAYRLRLIANTGGFTATDQPVAASVFRGAPARLHLPLIAPQGPGRYHLSWSMAFGNEIFGEPLHVAIEVA